MPTSVFWEITESCNLSCSHCYNAELVQGRKEGVGPDLSRTEAERVADRLKQSGVRNIHFLGGEPFVRRDLLDLCRYIRALGMTVNITTNGTIASDRWLGALGELDLGSLYISLDGTTAEINDAIRGAGVFERVINNTMKIRRVLDGSGARTRLSLSYSLCASNWDSVADLPELLEEAGFHEASIGVIQPSGDAFDRPDLTELKMDQVCVALDRLFARLESFPHLRISLRNLKPMVVKYFMTKYPRHGLAISEKSLACPAWDQNVLLRADGQVYPCGPSMLIPDGKSGNVREDAVALLPKSGRSIMEVDLQTSPEDSEFSEFLGFTKNTYSGSESCRECEFSQRCQVCPLFDQSDNGRMVACDWARDGLSSMYRDLLARVPKRSSGFAVNSDPDGWILEGDGLASSFRLNDSAKEILDRMDGCEPLSAIVEGLERDYEFSGLPSAKELVLSFCYKLQDCGAIKFDS